ncbi:MAG: hypothetical protein R3283_01165 [Balneolaceae bacterium]|nr:hypothetical protein [Balneolaceae bacterium]
MTIRTFSLFLLLTVLGLLLSVAPLYSQQNEALQDSLNRASELFRTGEEQEGLDLYLKILEDYPTNLEALWNTTVIYARIGHRADTENRKRNNFEKAMDYAQRALEHHPESGYAHYAMAVAKGRMTEVLDTGDSIENSNDMKDHLQEAADKLPDFAPLWHLYGVWHSDVANVSGIGRAAAGLFGEGLPDASNEKAEEYLKRAISLDSDNILFRMDLARHYRDTDQQEEAVDTLQELLKLEPRMQGDERMLNQAKEMLQDFSQ